MSSTDGGDLVPTRYQALAVTEKHRLQGQDLNTDPQIVYVSEDLTGDLAAQAAVIMVYMNATGMYLTFTAPGLLEGNSHQLALVAACMGLPNTMAYTGGIMVHNYPDEPTVLPIQGLTEKLTATKAARYRLVCPIPNMVSAAMASSGVLTLADVTSGAVENPSWYLIGVTSASELINAHLASIAGDYLVKEKAGILSYEVPEAKPPNPAPSMAKLREDYDFVSEKLLQGLDDWGNKMVDEYPGSKDDVDRIVSKMEDEIIGPQYLDKQRQVGNDVGTIADLLQADRPEPERNTLARAIGSLGLVVARAGGNMANLPPIGVATRQLAKDIADLRDKYKKTNKVSVKKGFDRQYQPLQKRRFYQGPQGSLTVLQEQSPQNPQNPQKPAKRQRTSPQAMNI